jgi:FkbM family methyltransferase
MYYGQHGEDKYIEEFFTSGYKGVCIDVGASEPTGGSNTYYFEKNGWTVYAIEPNPYCVQRLKEHRQNVFKLAISNENQKDVAFTICTLNNGEMGAVSSLKIDEALLQAHQMYSPKLEQITVETKTLDTFIEENGITEIDFISIDTEGTELDVLKGFDINKFSPKLFVIENNYDSSEIADYLETFGYTRIKRVVVNDFFIKK